MSNRQITIPARPKPVLPEDFALLLQRMHEAADPELSSVLRSANKAGWTMQELGDAIGISFQAVQQRIKHPDRKPSPRSVPLDPDVKDQLRAMYVVARKVNGGTATDHPSRRTSEELSKRLAELVGEGVSVYTLASAIGVTFQAIIARLYRHGYRDRIAPSRVAVTKRYQNRKVGGRTES